MNRNKTLYTFVADSSGSARLDIWLACRIPGLSRRKAVQAIEDGKVFINGLSCSKSQIIVSGDVVTVFAPLFLKDWTPKPKKAFPLIIHYQDDDLLVVEKPCAVSSVPLRPDETDTLSNVVVAHFPECAKVGKREGDGGLLQRLDYETSGAVMVGRSQQVYDILVNAQQKDKIEKSYLALVHGSTPDRFSVETPLVGSGVNNCKTAVFSTGRVYRTDIFTVSSYKKFTLVKAVIHRGARHQIRVHLAHKGFPIAMDSMYCSFPDLWD